VPARIAAYVYPGWHPIAERDESFYAGFTEWDLVYPSRPRFDGHVQPRLPRDGRYDDRDSVDVERRVRLATAYGVDALIYGFFWCRGKRVFQSALDDGFLGAPVGGEVPFAVMWANRMPRRVLPVRRTEAPVIEAFRLVPSDLDDFVTLVAYVAERYFSRPNYLRVDGKLYFSIFDSTFFVRGLGRDAARRAITAARAWLQDHGYDDLCLVAIDPAEDVIADVREIGFDGVSHYVFLPEWKGPQLQDYATLAAQRATEWARFTTASGLPYSPSVSPGWDASPRAADFAEIGAVRPHKYPWSPVITGEHPDLFAEAARRAVRHAGDGLVMVASLNEWSEGHYLEPDTRFGLGWLEALRSAR